jgi:glycosyltransferase involved in cell wall biosynthesis
MSAGCATLAPNNCGNSEAIKDKINGFLYPTRNLQSAVTILDNLIRDANLRTKIAIEAQKDVELHFDIKRTEKELIGVLTPILNTNI